MERKLVAALACRNKGSRMYGKPLQNLDIENSISILDNIISCLQSIKSINEIVLGISDGIENEIFEEIAKKKGIQFIKGDENDVLDRLIKCGLTSNATDIFRVTSESPFLYFEPVEKLWNKHVINDFDATFFDNIIDGCGFEIIKLDALIKSHLNGTSKHRSELCTLYMRENKCDFNINFEEPNNNLNRKDLRLTVDNPEDLIVCREVYKRFQNKAPFIDINEVVQFLDNNPNLIKLISPFVENGYKTMYI